jgi:hypothetical protein
MTGRTKRKRFFLRVIAGLGLLIMPSTPLIAWYRCALFLFLVCPSLPHFPPIPIAFRAIRTPAGAAWEHGRAGGTLAQIPNNIRWPHTSASFAHFKASSINLRVSFHSWGGSNAPARSIVMGMLPSQRKPPSSVCRLRMYF